MKTHRVAWLLLALLDAIEPTHAGIR
eukprot:SAG31_NODE_4277_length_3385_cov_3.624163_1_plen_25_part_10